MNLRDEIWCFDHEIDIEFEIKLYIWTRNIMVNQNL